MADRPDRIDADRLEARLEAMAGTVAALAARVAALEAARRGPASASTPDTGEGVDSRGHPALDLVGLLAPAGRTCLVLGGAYLLRALTDSGRLPLAGGVLIGLLYAVAWFGAAERAAPNQPVSAVFHGFAGALIGLPILWEASMRFHLLPPEASALALAGFLLAAFAVAWHRGLQSLAGIVSLGTASMALGLAVATGSLWPYAFLLVGVSFASWWLGEARRWPWLCWPAGLLAAVAVAPLGLRAALDPPPDPPRAAIAVAILFAGGTTVRVAVRAARREGVRLFDATQTALALGAGLGAAFTIAQRLGEAAHAALALGTLAGGFVAGAFALRVLRVRPVAGRDFYYVSTLALVLAVAGITTLASGTPRDLAFTLLAVLCAWLGARGVHPVFAAHSAILALAAALSSGLIACSAAIWLSTPASWPAFPPTGWIVLIAALPGGLLPRQAANRALERVASMSRLVLAIVLVLSLASLLVLAIGPLLAGTPPDPGRLATMKTIILSAAAVALAVIARLPFGGELGWLAYPVLLACGLKILLEDFRVSRAAMLFVALGVYGTALILTARIRTTHRA
jgi:hypothetical protein